MMDCIRPPPSPFGAAMLDPIRRGPNRRHSGSQQERVSEPNRFEYLAHKPLLNAFDVNDYGLRVLAL